MVLTVSHDSFRLAEAFTISRGSRTEAKVLTVRIERNGVVGTGECVPYARYEQTMASVAEEIDAVSDLLQASDLGTLEIRDHMPAGAARNAVDCAVLDWRCKAADQRVWEILPGLRVPGLITTAFTLSLDVPEKMQQAASRNAHRPLLKIKLGTPDDMARLEAVRAGAPDTAIIVDANEGWTTEIYTELAPHLVRLGVKLVEQPLPEGQDDLLREIERPLPVCADESCHDRTSLDDLIGKYDVVNIKLDKTGGLSEAINLRSAAEANGFDIMVGCMVGSSLAMAPAVCLAQGVSFVDLDGPLLLAEDRDVPLNYDGTGVHPPSRALWG